MSLIEKTKRITSRNIVLSLYELFVDGGGSVPKSGSAVLSVLPEGELERFLDTVTVNGHTLSEIIEGGPDILSPVENIEIKIDAGLELASDDSFTLALSAYEAQNSPENAIAVRYTFKYVSSNLDKQETSSTTTLRNFWPLTDLIPDDTDNIYDILFSISNEKYLEDVYVNSRSVNEMSIGTERGFTIPIESIINKDLYLFVNPKCSDSFTITAKLYKFQQVSPLKTVRYTYIPNKYTSTNTGRRNSINISGSNVSYALLRTTPKLTGNIKLVIDSKSDIYLDTFKVSDTLSERKYRRVAINREEYFGKSVMAAFKGIPSSELYRVEPKCYNLFSTTQSWNEQFYDTYRCGVKTNDDELYPENFALLAPICVKDIIPDFFVVFRVEPSDFNENEHTDKEVLEYFLQNGVQVKSYDLRRGSKIGDYLRKIAEEGSKFPGDIFVAYDDNSRNQFNGISLDRGVVTTAYESVFSEHEAINQVGLNDFYTKGFERNKLISRNVVNLESKFDDIIRDEDGNVTNNFSINTYFGLYVKLNGQKSEYACIGIEDDNTNIFNRDDISTFPSGVDFGVLTTQSGTPLENLLYGIATPDGFTRLHCSIYDSKEIADNYCNKIYRSISNLPTSELRMSGIQSMMTIELLKPLIPGEHIRAVNYSTKMIYDAVFSNWEEYDSHKGDISSVNIRPIDGGWTLQTIAVYVDGNDSVETEAEKLFYAFRNFDELGVYSYSWINGKVSLLSYAPDTWLEHICARERNDSDILFLGVKIPHIVEVNNIGIPEQNRPWDCYEDGADGSRDACIVKFQPVLNDTSFSAPAPEDKIFNEPLVYYNFISGQKNIKDYTPWNISYKPSLIPGLIETKEAYVIPSFEENGNILLNVDCPLIERGVLSLYSRYTMNDGICTIFPLKDYVFDVLDKESYIRGEWQIGGVGTYNKTVGGRALTEESEEYVRHYIYKKDETNEYLEPKSDALFNKASGFKEYLTSVYTGSILEKDKGPQQGKFYSDISLVCPETFKWNGIGADAYGNEMRVMFEMANLYSCKSKSYYIPYTEEEGEYNAEAGYQYNPDVAANKYYPKTLTSIIENEDSKYGMPIKDYINSKGLSFSDILYGKGNTYAKTSLSYNSGSNSIDFISCGIKCRLKSNNSNILNFEKYAGYQAALLMMPGYNTKHPEYYSELIINEVTKEMLLVVYIDTTSVAVNSNLITNLSHVQGVPEGYCIRQIKHGALVTFLVIPYADELPFASSLATKIVLEGVHYGEDAYRDRDDIAITGEYNQEDQVYGEAGKSIVVTSPMLWFNEEEPRPLNVNNMGILTESVSAVWNGYIMAKLPEEQSSTEIEDLDERIKNCAITISTGSEVLDYTLIEDLLEVTRIEPYPYNDFKDGMFRRSNINDKSYVLPTFAEPAKKDMFLYEYSVIDEQSGEADPTKVNLDNIFGYSFTNSGISLSGIETLNQMWFTKYSQDSAFCTQNKDYRLCVDLRKGESIIRSPWASDLYTSYSIGSYPNDILTYLDGYETSSDLKTFLGSRGVVLADKIVLTNWKNTYVDEERKLIRIDISDTILNVILSSRNYLNAWGYLRLPDDKYRSEYIKKVILNYITINNKTPFELYHKESSDQSVSFAVTENYDESERVRNFKNELKFEGGKYYMYIYPYSITGNPEGIYYAKMTVEL